MANDFVKALLEELFTNWAKSSLSCLSFQQLLVKHLTKTCDIDTASRLVAHLLNKVLALFNPFSRWQKVVEDVFSTDGFLNRCKLSLFLAY